MKSEAWVKAALLSQTHLGDILVTEKKSPQGIGSDARLALSWVLAINNRTTPGILLWTKCDPVSHPWEDATIPPFPCAMGGALCWLALPVLACSPSSEPSSHSQPLSAC